MEDRPSRSLHLPRPRRCSQDSDDSDLLKTLERSDEDMAKNTQTPPGQSHGGKEEVGPDSGNVRLDSRLREWRRQSGEKATSPLRGGTRKRSNTLDQLRRKSAGGAPSPSPSPSMITRDRGRVRHEDAHLDRPQSSSSQVSHQTPNPQHHPTSLDLPARLRPISRLGNLSGSSTSLGNVATTTTTTTTSISKETQGLTSPGATGTHLHVGSRRHQRSKTLDVEVQASKGTPKSEESSNPEDHEAGIPQPSESSIRGTLDRLLSASRHGRRLGGKPASPSISGLRHRARSPERLYYGVGGSRRKTRRDLRRKSDVRHQSHRLHRRPRRYHDLLTSSTGESPYTSSINSSSSSSSLSGDSYRRSGAGDPKNDRPMDHHGDKATERIRAPTPSTMTMVSHGPSNATQPISGDKGSTRGSRPASRAFYNSSGRKVTLESKGEEVLGEDSRGMLVASPTPRRILPRRMLSESDDSELQDHESQWSEEVVRLRERLKLLENQIQEGEKRIEQTEFLVLTERRAADAANRQARLLQARLEEVEGVQGELLKELQGVRGDLEESEARGADLQVRYTETLKQLELNKSEMERLEAMVEPLRHALEEGQVESRSREMELARSRQMVR